MQRFKCVKHGEVSNTIRLPGDDRDFCPLCRADMLHGASVPLLEAVHVGPGELQQEPAEPPASS